MTNNMSAVHQEEYNGYRISICPDDNAQSPREQSNLGTMTCFHSKYRLGDEHDFDSPADLAEWLHEHEVIQLPLFLLDHSGITINTTGFRGCDPQGWDWGQVGVIYVEEEKARKEFGTNCREKTLKYLQGEVDIYDQYLQGNVYGFLVTKEIKCHECGHIKHDEIDSCWGFFEQEHCLNEAKSVVNSLIGAVPKGENS